MGWKSNTTEKNGVFYPSMFDEPLNDSWLSHVNFQSIRLSKKLSLDVVFFLNQVSGKTPNNVDYGVNIDNDIDGCIQFSNAVSDCLSFPYPPNIPCMQYPAVNTDNTGHPPIFTKIKHGQRQKFRKRRKIKARSTQGGILNSASTGCNMTKL